MFQAPGRYFPVSDFRRLVTDLMHFSAKVPTVTIVRHMNLAPLVAARDDCTPSPTWSAIFARAHALVAARSPVLRTSYLTFPWPRFYEHANSVATINVDRETADERVILYALVTDPARLSLREIDDIIRFHKTEPLENIPSYRRAVRVSRLPWPFRRLVWWAGLNVLGPKRCRYFGTFGTTSLGSAGADLSRLVSLLTSQLHYGAFEDDGGLDMRLSFDHRVMDGAAAAQALADLEDVLLDDIVRECDQLRSRGNPSPNPQPEHTITT